MLLNVSVLFCPIICDNKGPLAERKLLTDLVSLCHLPQFTYILSRFHRISKSEEKNKKKQTMKWMWRPLIHQQPYLRMVTHTAWFCHNISLLKICAYYRPFPIHQNQFQHLTSLMEKYRLGNGLGKSSIVSPTAPPPLMHTDPPR